MEINPSPPGSGLGPRPAGLRRTARVRLSTQRTAILERLTNQPQPTSVAALVTATRLHENTVREHLDALIEAGLAERTRAPAIGRGRPAWLYSATNQVDPAASEYAGLAAALAAHIERTSTAPQRDALDAGRSWGRDLAQRDQAQRDQAQRDQAQRDRAQRDPDQRDPEPAPSSGAAARRRVVALLDDLGFAPEPNARNTQARLTRCPLLEAAHRHPQIVCGVHLGIVQGAMEEYGLPTEQVERTDLLPFAEPGACTLHLLTRRSPGRR